MTSSRTVIVAGAGIGGLTAALALARNGFRVIVLEQAELLEETGAGIQISPNAARTLIDLGLESRLRPHVVAPTALRVLSAATGREIVRMPLGEAAEQRYGAPYWVIHRGDLQAALAAAVSGHLDITVKLGVRVEDFVAHTNGVTVSAHGHAGITEERGLALLAADGLWSLMRKRIGGGAPPRFAGRTAWRGLVPARQVAPEFREPLVHLWLGRDAHLVHYPVKAGRVINIVAITTDSWNAPGWSEPASPADLIPRLAGEAWAPPARALVGLPEAWLKWALYDRRPIRRWSQGPVALLGDAAHPMLPFLAQGAAMAIEDAAVAAQCLARQPDDATGALRTYCTVRRARTRRVQRVAARNGARYHLAGARGRLRDAAMRMTGGKRLLQHYDWLYGWRPPAAISIT
ncbi:MAG TPA: FAD-dependent monooxygenase [Xanthobacteraceae bacterium]|nr:FAD-dependent monooxygenase [Xanthobacteraceae bacterium]